MQKQLIKLGLLFVLFLASAAGFIAIADEVLEGESSRFDEAVLSAIHATSAPFWDTFYQVVTQLGGVIAVLVVSIAAVSFALYRKKVRQALFIAASVGGAALINVILKLLFERPRPDLWEQLIVETSFSFPSGHAMASMALAATAAILLWNTRYRWWSMGLGVAYALVIGYSRLYLGVHYPTDVVAGWLVSIVWVLLVAAVLFGTGFTRRIRASNP